MKNLSLAVDVGNSQISFGVFEGNNLIARTDYKTPSFEVDPFVTHIIKFANENNIGADDCKKSMICSVVPRLTRLIQISIKSVFGIEPKLLGEEELSYVSMEIDDPSEVGGDLIADLVAAKEIYGCPALVVDLGTLTKNLVLDKRGVFVGTSFYPGLQVCLDAMSEKAELIPSAEELRVPQDYLGTNTKDAMNAGIYYVTTSAVSKIGETCNRLYGVEHKILTGGFAELIGEYVKGFTIDSDLALKGLNILMNK